MVDDFTGHPPSVTELRGLREDNAALWTPRDALISALRDLDEGRMNTDTLVVCWLEKDPNGVCDSTQMCIASKDFNRTIGLLTRITTWLANKRG